MATETSDGPVVPSADSSPDSVNKANSPATQLSDPEKQDAQDAAPAKKASAFQSLGWLDRFLAVWILLAMILGVLLGNFVPETGPALQKGKFAEVSVPIGMGHNCLFVVFPLLTGIPQPWACSS